MNFKVLSLSERYHLLLSVSLPLSLSLSLFPCYPVSPFSIQIFYPSHSSLASVSLLFFFLKFLVLIFLFFPIFLFSLFNTGVQLCVFFPVISWLIVNKAVKQFDHCD